MSDWYGTISPVKLTTRALNRATLARQLLLRREPVAAEEAVRRVVALQAQHAASPYLALWNRVERFDPATLDALFADRILVKASLMRITLHAVHRDDYATFHQAVQPTLRAARLNDRRFRSTGLTPADADALVPGVLDFLGEPRTGAEAEAWLADRSGSDSTWVWWALRHYAPIRHAPTGGPWSFGQRPAYEAADDGPRPADPAVCTEALQTLVLRYLSAFGPASMADVAQFSVINRGFARDAVRALADGLERLEGPDGAELYDVPGAPRADEETPAPARLLPMWDSVLLAHADRSRILPADYRMLVTRTNGDVLPTLLVDGCVAGVWRPVDGGIEATAFHRLPQRAWDELAGEARGLVAVLADREPLVYRRYDRWWSGLPAAEVRILPEE